ncbi:GNAT family N-acetyltransferase [Sphingomonas immobilis]|uniref:GNAT family N-acetyltransferase n=1 Tax=Sphingomonas immobilis TaxID=3063997 RepID=A0ABT9A2C3_9SPHN|nr:GNAT family N-acetyltransferase [Sphingomonas sp. CA1-15]MDO7843141.1 GNAT family N-acetyltransferase [Sphingomonas sp. CA1-15]
MRRLLPAPGLARALAALGLVLRPEAKRDLPFLKTLYASTRARELALMLNWNADQRAAFVAQQFEAQRTHYRSQFSKASFHVIEREGVPIGRLYLDRRETAIHIVDIALLPEVRRQGLGTALLGEIIDVAGAAGLGVSLSVTTDNPARHLYDRSGFVEIGSDDVYVEMLRPRDVS